MDKQKLEDYYFERNSTIFSEMLDEDENYQRLKKAKRAAEKALQNVISKEAWKQYLALDEIGNELECTRYNVSGRCYRLRKIIQMISMPPPGGIFSLQ